MKTQVDERLRREAEAFDFRFSCEHCVHFDEASDTCAEGFPNDEHRSARLDREELFFCKIFEVA